MKATIIIALIMLITGCAGMEQKKQHSADIAKLESYIATNAPLVDAEKMKRSTYYKGLYDVFAASSFNDKAIQMGTSADLYALAIKLESGEISQEQFQAEKMKIVAYNEQQVQQLNSSIAAQKEARANAAYQQYMQSLQLQQRNKPINCNSYQIGNNVNTTCY